jgi:hypothetical protein
VPEVTTEVGISRPPLHPADPLCACDKNVLGVIVFLALAAGIAFGMILVGFDHPRKRR